MPRVSERYRDARREYILDAARRAFARNGFHATSMQDLFDEARLSSGVIYRYFAGKDEVVIAIVEDNMRQIGALIRAVTGERADGSFGAALAAAVEAIRDKHRENGLAGIGVQAWTEALRDPRIGAAFEELLTGLRSELAEVVAQYQLTGALPTGPSSESLASITIAILVGYIQQLALLGPDAVADTAEALRALWPPALA